MLFDRTQSTRIPAIWNFLDRHHEMLHKVWIDSMAFAVTCAVVNPLAGWKELIAVPILTVFMGAVVAIAELPLTMILVLLVSVGWVVVDRLQANKQP